MSADQIARVRQMCLALSGTSEKLSHGEPTFFVDGRTYAMFANNHHGDGHIAVWVPAPPGTQTTIIAGAPDKYFKPPYVGPRGWIGIELPAVSDDGLRFHLTVAHDLIAKPPRPVKRVKTKTTPQPPRGRRAR